MSKQIKFEGVEKVKENLLKEQKKYPKALAAALYAEGFVIIGKSLSRTPADTGRLRNSAYVAPPTNEDAPEVEVGYGTNYAIYVHEAKPGTRFRVGENKFLQKAVNESSNGFVRRVGDRVKGFHSRDVGVSAIPKEYPTQTKYPSKKSDS